jgi:hypothetical protein
MIDLYKRDPLRDIVADYNAIDTAKEISRRKLTSANVFELTTGLKELSRNGETTTISESLANYYRRFGLAVKIEGIGWRISVN